MNLFVIAKLLGLLLTTLGVAMLPAVGWGLYYGDGGVIAILEAMAVTFITGAALFFVGRSRKEDLFRREATVVVALGWVLVAMAGALPFYFAGAFPTYTDCFFESMSGFTTTGASVLEDFEALPQALHFWRCFTHWLGGMGIIVLFVAILPFLGAGGRALMKSEVPGPVTEALTPRIKDTAMVLWKLYCFFTVLETGLLMLCGMSLFQALCHTFATLATGGFSTHPQSVAGFQNLPAEITIIFFMLVAGTNFSLFYSVLRGNRKALFKDPEYRTYVLSIFTAILFIALVLRYGAGLYVHFGQALRDSAFQVLSIVTTTGFATTNTDLWPTGIKALLTGLMFLGGCAGSTGGGIKVIRWMLLFKIGFTQVEKIYSPRTVRKVRIGSTVINEGIQTTALVFFFIWITVFALGAIVLSLLEQGTTSGSGYDHFVTMVSAVAATLNNIGPGFGLVGAVENYNFFSAPAKWLLCFFMLLGRLELYTILVLFAPPFWRLR